MHVTLEKNAVVEQTSDLSYDRAGDGERALFRAMPRAARPLFRIALPSAWAGQGLALRSAA